MTNISDHFAGRKECAATGIREQCAWEWDARSGFFLFSPEWRYIYDFPDDAPLRMSLDDLCAAVRRSERQSLSEAFQNLAGGEARRLEEVFPLRRLDGTWVWLLARGAPGRAGFFVGSFTDVSKLRFDQKFLPPKGRAPDTLYQSLLDNSSFLIARMDRELFPLYMNHRLRDLFATPPEEPGAFKLSELGLSDEYFDFISRCVGKVFNHGVTVRGKERFMTLHGEVDGDFTFWPEFGADGGVTSVICTMRDYKERIRIEQALRFNQRRLAALYQLMQMSDATEAEVFQFVVESIIELTGSFMAFLFIPSGDLRGKGRMVWSRRHYQELHPSTLPSDRLLADCFTVPVDEAGNHVLPYVNNGDGIHPTHYSHYGHLPIMRGVFVPVYEEGRAVCLASMCNKATDYDMDDLRQVELFLSGARSILRRRENLVEMKRAKENAERANRVKDQFLANVSHELRTPLNGMLSMLQLLELTGLTEEQLEYARTAGLSGQALLRILSDILDFSRMELDKMEMRSSLLNIASTIRSVLSLFAGEAEAKNVAIERDLDDGLPDELLGDEARIRQILFNLVGNALKFTEKGSITVHCSKLGHDLHGKTWIYLLVKDTGIGMEEDNLQFIFDPFTRFDSSGARKHSGTGLGLSIVKKIVLLMGGRLSVESERGLGSSIHLSLPLDPAPLPGTEESGRGDKKTPAFFMDILVAEDDKVSQHALRIFLQRLGHRVLCVPDGRRALEALKLYPFHCLITDIQMPEMDGIELVRRIRSGGSGEIVPGLEIRKSVSEVFPGELKERGVPVDIPVAALTAHAISGYREMLLQEGMDVYLAKPVLFRDLEAMLDSIMERPDVKARARNPAPQP